MTIFLALTCPCDNDPVMVSIEIVQPYFHLLNSLKLS